MSASVEFPNHRVAVVIPCYNEGGAIGQVVTDFRAALPTADIYVYDNNSSDGTVAEATEAGAIVRFERRQGKGHVVRRMFSDIDADVFIMADGDGTYEAAKAPEMVQLLLDEQLDMVVGTRIAVQGHDTYRSGHVLGNFVLTHIAQFFFGKGFSDILSGYRVFSRRFVKTFPMLSRGFEIETEMTTHTLVQAMPFGEVETAYSERAGDTASKLNTYRDGVWILWTMIRLFKDYRPMMFFAVIGSIQILASLLLAIPVVEPYLSTGIVTRVPLAILCTGIMLTGMLSITSGMILDSVAQQRIETKRLNYLRQSAPTAGRPETHTAQTGARMERSA